MLIELFGLILSSGTTAVIVDALISARIAAITGGVRGRPRHHVVVCGLGRIGTSVAERLKARGVPAVAIESQEDAPGVLRARQLNIPVIGAMSGDASAQQLAGITRADAVLAVTDDEAVNLEIALVAKNADPCVRVVARLFDHDLANRVERRLRLGPTPACRCSPPRPSRPRPWVDAARSSSRSAGGSCCSPRSRSSPARPLPAG